MPLRLYSYLLIEMVQVIAITTGVLVTVIAFGAVIKPLAGESMLTAGRAIVRLLRDDSDAAVRTAVCCRLRQHAGHARFVNDNEFWPCRCRPVLPHHSGSRAGIRCVVDAHRHPDPIGHSHLLRSDGPDAGRR